MPIRYTPVGTVMLLTATTIHAQTAAVPSATVESGILSGASIGGVDSFKGIPFAAPPVGPLRWHAPEPAPQWKGVRESVEYGHDCMQKPFPSDAAPLGTAPAEDCLVMNIWRPSGTALGQRLPVLVWIYGGGFVNGGSSPSVYDGSKLAKAGVIVVSFNYRLGRFGFFAHPAISAAKQGPVGNYGLMDQQAALRWVNRNVVAFGGDPSQVTIMGESAGGMSVTALLGAPAVRGLFRGAIIMSGGGRTEGRARALATDRPGQPSAETIGSHFAEGVGIRGDDAMALQALRNLPAETIVSDLNLAAMAPVRQGIPTYSGPFEDGITLTGTNEEVFAKHRQTRVPIMVGATSGDIGFGGAQTKEELFASFGSHAVSARTTYDPTGELELGALKQMVYGDRMMIEPARFLARQFTIGGQPTWYYRFSYVAESLMPGRSLAPHASDIPFFFDTASAKYGSALTLKDKKMAEAIKAYVVAFVKKGSPAAPALPMWQPIDAAGKGPIMDFATDGRPAPGADPLSARLDTAEPK